MCDVKIDENSRVIRTHYQKKKIIYKISLKIIKRV